MKNGFNNFHICFAKKWLKLLIELDKTTNKTGGLYISFKIQQSASASVIGQRPNFTIADYPSSADCKNCSFGHCLQCRNVKLGFKMAITIDVC